MSPPLIIPTKRNDSPGGSALPRAAVLTALGGGERNTPGEDVQTQLPPPPPIAERGSWQAAIGSGPQELIRRLSREHLTAQNLNERVYEMLEVLGKDVPFFKNVFAAASEKGHRFELDLDALEQVVSQNKGRQSFGAAFAERIASEGVHVARDENRPRTYAGPAALEARLRSEAVIDMTASAVGALVGATADRNIKAGLSPASLPNGDLSEETLVRALLTAFDGAVDEARPILQGFDRRSQQTIMSRQVSYAFSGKIEKAVTAQLQALGILGEKGELRKLDIAGVMRTVEV